MSRDKARKPSAYARIAAERREYVVVDDECVIRPCDAGNVLREKSLGYWRHIDRTEGVPGEECLVKLFGDGECSEVPWLNFVEPVPTEREAIKNNQNQNRVKRTRERNPVGKGTHSSNILGISPSCDRISRMRTLFQGVDAAKRIDVLLEIG